MIQSSYPGLLQVLEHDRLPIACGSPANDDQLASVRWKRHDFVRASGIRNTDASQKSGISNVEWGENTEQSDIILTRTASRLPLWMNINVLYVTNTWEILD